MILDWYHPFNLDGSIPMPSLALCHHKFVICPIYDPYRPIVRKFPAVVVPPVVLTMFALNYKNPKQNNTIIIIIVVVFSRDGGSTCRGMRVDVARSGQPVEGHSITPHLSKPDGFSFRHTCSSCIRLALIREKSHRC